MKQTNAIFTGVFCMFCASFCLPVFGDTKYTVTPDVFDCLEKVKYTSGQDELTFDEVTFKKGDDKTKKLQSLVTLDKDEYDKITGHECYKDIKNGLKLQYKGTRQEISDGPLMRASTSKTVDPNKLCVSVLGNDNGSYETNGDCTYVRPEFGICDTHAYNARESTNPEDSSKRDFIRDVVGLKVTVISQQMYKQYEYLNATLKRLKTQLQKSVLNAKLEMACAKSESSGGSSGGGYKTYLAGADNCTNKMNKNAAYPCIQNNLNLIINATDTNVNQARKQLADTLEAAEAWEITDKEHPAPDACKSTSKADIKKCAQLMNVKVSNKIDELKNKSNGQIIQLGLQSNQ